MRIIDLHCYPGTKEWITCQGPYVEALAKYWNRRWTGKDEDQVIKDFTDAGVQAVLVALDLETTIGTQPVSNEYVHAMWKRHPQRIIQAWGAIEPAKGDVALIQIKKTVRELGLLGFHFHPIMQHFAVNDRRYYPLFEVINELKAAVMIDVGTTGMGAGLPGGMGAEIFPGEPQGRHARAAAGQDHVRQRLPEPALRAPPQGVAGARLLRRGDGEDLPPERRARPRALIRRDPGLGDEFFPALDIGADLRRDFLGAAGSRHHALLHERLAHLRSREYGRYLLVPFLDDLARQAGRARDPEVEVDVEVREPELREARRIGREHRAPLPGHRDHGELARPCMRQRGMHRKDRELYLAAEQVGERLGGALVRHVQDVDPETLLQELDREVLRRAVARRRVVELALARGSLELLQVPDRQRRRIHHQRHITVRYAPDRREVPDRIVRNRLVQGRRDGEGIHRHHQRVAVGWRLGHGRGANVAARAGLVVDDHRLFPALAQLRADGARDDVDAGSRRVGDHQRNGAAGVGLRSRIKRDQRQGRQQKSVHSFPSMRSSLTALSK